MTRIVNTDTLLGASGLIASAILLANSYRQNASVFVLPGDAPPFLVPQLFLFILGGISAAILIGGLVRGGVSLDRRNWLLVSLCFAIVVIAAALMPLLGYLVVAPVTVMAVIALLGYRNLIVNGAVTLGMVGFLYLLLVRFAQMPLPEGPGLGI